tara:strand:+ start:322 stop:471 length:150 start_codon:yes stop_codon:yes gene_type:complete
MVVSQRVFSRAEKKCHTFRRIPLGIKNKRKQQQQQQQQQQPVCVKTTIR